MRHFPGWQAAYMSFYSTDLYRDVAKGWKGVAYLYLTVVTLVTVLIASIGMQIHVAQNVARYFDPVIPGWPKLTVKDGKFTMDKASPYSINQAGTSFIFLFDMDDSRLPKDSQGLLIAKDDVYMFDALGNRKAMGYSAVLPMWNGMVLDKSFMESTSQSLKTTLWPICFLFFFPGTLINLMIWSLVWSLVGRLIAAICKADLTGVQLIRLAVVAMTPPTVLTALLFLLLNGMNELFLTWLVSFPLTLGWLVLGISANAPEGEPTSA